MINKINDNNLLNTQSSLQEAQSAQNVSTVALKNAYATNRASLIDETDISKEAVSLYQREQEINKTHCVSQIKNQQSRQVRP